MSSIPLASSRPFLPPVGESPVLSLWRAYSSPGGVFLPPVGESPVLSAVVALAGGLAIVSTPCRGITCAELRVYSMIVQLGFLPPVGESPVLSRQAL